MHAHSGDASFFFFLLHPTNVCVLVYFFKFFFIWEQWTFNAVKPNRHYITCLHQKRREKNNNNKPVFLCNSKDFCWKINKNDLSVRDVLYKISLLHWALEISGDNKVNFFPPRCTRGVKNHMEDCVFLPRFWVFLIQYFKKCGIDVTFCSGRLRLFFLKPVVYGEPLLTTNPPFFSLASEKMALTKPCKERLLVYKSTTGHGFVNAIFEKYLSVFFREKCLFELCIITLFISEPN